MPGSTRSDQSAGAVVRRLHWGCGGHPTEGWINSDKGDYPGVELVCDILDGLPLETGSMEYAVSIHALPEISYHDVVPTLAELRRVLEPGGVLRLSLPDLDRGIRAYTNGERDYFLVPDRDARTLGGKFITQILWYGWSRTLFTRDFLEELLRKAGFADVAHCEFRQTASRFPEIVGLDNRERESLFVEATK
jgi:SAM-dependent methyltransferase